jgi:hypothetical protein
MQDTINKNSERLKQLGEALSIRHGKNFKGIRHQTDSSEQNISVYKNEEYLNSDFIKIVSHVTEKHSEFNKLMKSSGITFIDKYESILQYMMDGSEELKSILQDVSFINEAVNAAIFIWETYCKYNKTDLFQLMDNSYADIENELLQFI